MKSKSTRNFSAMSEQALYLLSKHSVDPAERRAAKAELERRRAALPDSTKLEEKR